MTQKVDTRTDLQLAIELAIEYADLVARGDLARAVSTTSSWCA